MSFKSYYRTIFSAFGYPLNNRTGLATRTLAAAESRLGVRIPQALRDYYVVAGNERRFSKCHNRFLPPSDWSIDKYRLVFMEENQSVLWWGVSVRNRTSADPAVWQGICDESITWVPEHRKCSVFVAIMLHYQAVNGGLPYCGSALAPDESGYRFEDHGWTEYGLVGSMIAYSRANQVVCLMPPGDLPFMQRWTVLAGGRTAKDLNAIANDLGLAFS